MPPKVLLYCHWRQRDSAPTAKTAPNCEAVAINRRQSRLPPCRVHAGAVERRVEAMGLARAHRADEVLARVVEGDGASACAAQLLFNVAGEHTVKTIIREGRSVPPDEVFEAWTCGDVERMTRALSLRTNPTLEEPPFSRAFLSRASLSWGLMCS